MAAAPPLALIVVGGIGVVVSVADFRNTVNIIRNEAGPTWCTVTRLMLDIAGVVLGTVGIAQGIRAWRASGSILQWASNELPSSPGSTPASRQELASNIANDAKGNLLPAQGDGWRITFEKAARGKRSIVVRIMEKGGIRDEAVY